MAEVEIYGPHPPYQNIVNVVVGSNTDFDPEIETEFAYNYPDGNEVSVDGVFGFTDVNGATFQELDVIDGTRFNLVGIGSSTQTYIGGGLVRQDTRWYNKNSNNSGIKPIFHGTNLYFPVVEILFAGASSDRFMYMMQSTDTGTTWTVLDSSNSPSHGDNWNWSCVTTDTRIWFVLSGTSTSVSGRSWSTMRARAFDLTAGTWSALDTSTSVPFNEPGSPWYVEVFTLSNDRLFCYYHYSSLRANSTTIDFDRPAIAIFDISAGTWASVNNIVTRNLKAISHVTEGTGIPGTFTSSVSHELESGDRVTINGVTGFTGTGTISAACDVISDTVFSIPTSTLTGSYVSGGSYSYDGSMALNWAVPANTQDSFHLFYGKNAITAGTADFRNVFHKYVTVATDNVLSYGDEQVITTRAHLMEMPVGCGCSYTSGGNTIIEFPLNTSTSTATAGGVVSDVTLCITGTSSSEPTWTTATILNGSDSIPPESAEREGPWGAFAHNPTNNKIYFIYQLDDPDHPNGKTDLWITSKSVGGTWGSSTLWKTDSEYFYGHPSVYASDTRIHAVYSKVHPNDLSFGESYSAFVNLHDYPHYDVLEVCPECPSSGGNYAYLS